MNEPSPRLRIAALILSGPIGMQLLDGVLVSYEGDHVYAETAKDALKFADALIEAENTSSLSSTLIHQLSAANRELQRQRDDYRAQIDYFRSNFQQVADKARRMGLGGPRTGESNKDSETWWDWTHRLCTELTQAYREIRQYRTAESQSPAILQSELTRIAGIITTIQHILTTRIPETKLGEPITDILKRLCDELTAHRASRYPWHTSNPYNDHLSCAANYLKCARNHAKTPEDRNTIDLLLLSINALRNPNLDQELPLVPSCLGGEQTPRTGPAPATTDAPGERTYVPTKES